MAEDDLNRVESAVGEATPAPALEQLGVPESPSPAAASGAERNHRTRFAVGYSVLGVVLAAAVAGAVVIFTGDRSRHVAKPSENAALVAGLQNGELKAIEIADQVSRLYRTSTGAKLVDVVGTRNTLQDGNLGLLTVRYQYVQPFDAKNGDSQVLVPSNAIQYSLCGTGTTCAIPGKKSVARGLLLRQEALNLALSTFRELPTVDNVLTFLRPATAPTGFEGVTLMFQRSIVAAKFPRLMDGPLAHLPSASLQPESLTTVQQQQITDWTQGSAFGYRYQLLGGRDALIELQPQQ